MKLFDHYEFVPRASVPPDWWFMTDDGERLQAMSARPIYVPDAEANFPGEIDHWESWACTADGSGTVSMHLDSARTLMVWCEVPFPPDAEGQCEAMLIAHLLGLQDAKDIRRTQAPRRPDREGEGC